ncbi:hypothetical protein BD408DRAFT_426290 [Parasitella parasitica]|nr:hypothetical protein BD408DRAFT_426290 [Parasitella parasitica]
MISAISPVAMDHSKFYSRSTIKSRVAKRNQLHQIFISLKRSLTERRDHQEKRPQDGKTNPME